MFLEEVLPRPVPCTNRRYIFLEIVFLINLLSKVKDPYLDIWMIKDMLFQMVMQSMKGEPVTCVSWQQPWGSAKVEVQPRKKRREAQNSILLFKVVDRGDTDPM